MLLADSNASGQTWGRELTWRIENIDPEQLDWFHNGRPPKEREEPEPYVPKIEPFIPQTYLKPDPKALSQGVKKSIREQLGREPTDDEMRELASMLAGEYKDQYSAVVAGARAEYDQRVELYQSGDYEAGKPTYGEGAEVQDVDPTAGFVELFEDKFSGELDLIRRNKSTADAQALTNGAINKLTTMMGGNR
jgi:hypothetical protein